MIGIYFSGTGNSRYALELFLKKYDETAKAGYKRRKTYKRGQRYRVFLFGTI